MSNGPFIKIIGNTNIFKLENTTIYNITSYGPILDNTSKKVTIYLSYLFVFIILYIYFIIIIFQNFIQYFYNIFK